MGIAFCGVWYYFLSYFKNETNYIIVTNFKGVMIFLGVTAGLLILQVIFNSFVGKDFTFHDHGFQLALMAVVSTLTYIATFALGLLNLNLKEWAILSCEALFTMFLLYITIHINRKKSRERKLTELERLISLFCGLCAMEVYTYISISEEVKLWISI